MFSEEQIYSIALRRCHLIGDINFRKLIQAVGSAKQVWELPKKELHKTFGIGAQITKEIGNKELLDFAEKEINFCEKNKISIKLRHLKQLPELLSYCEDAPAILYTKGDYQNNLSPISIVGTRKITNYGKQFLEKFIGEIAANNVQIISGLAIGVDAEAHQQSLKNKITTCAVLAHGFQTIYPTQNKKIAEKILEEGGVLMTEFNSTQKPDRENFIQRNRIIAGISKATIVVETGFGGGSISTVGFANSYNREVFALPGKITDQQSQGCNQLIYQNKAMTISTIGDLLKELNIDQSDKIQELFPNTKNTKPLNDSQEKIYLAISQNPQISLDDLAEKLQQNAFEILPEILELEILGKVKSFSGRQFLAL